MATSTLIAHIDADYTTITDTTGGVWWPSDEALAEILASADPAATAVRIAAEQPMRGDWRS